MKFQYVILLIFLCNCYAFVTRSPHSIAGKQEIQSLRYLRKLTGDTSILPAYQSDSNLGAKAQSTNKQYWDITTIWSGVRDYGDIWSTSFDDVLSPFITTTITNFKDQITSLKNAIQQDQTLLTTTKNKNTKKNAKARIETNIAAINDINQQKLEMVSNIQNIESALRTSYEDRDSEINGKYKSVPNTDPLKKRHIEMRDHIDEALISAENALSDLKKVDTKCNL